MQPPHRRSRAPRHLPGLPAGHGHLCRLFGVEPDVVAHDLHPEYLSTKYALELDIEPWPVQHHHAHIASCLAEHGHTGTVLGIAFDGLGYGTDGTMWGGEFLVADFDGFERVGHLRPVAAAGRRGGDPRAVADGALPGPASPPVPTRPPDSGPALDRALEPGPRPRRAGLTAEPGRAHHQRRPPLRRRRRPRRACAPRSPTRARPRSSSRCSPPASPRASSPRYPVELRQRPRRRPRRARPGATRRNRARARSSAARDRAVIAAGFHEGLGRATAVLAAELAPEARARHRGA